MSIACNNSNDFKDGTKYITGLDTLKDSTTNEDFEMSHSEWVGQSTESKINNTDVKPIVDSLVLMKFWTECIIPLLNKDRKQLESVVHNSIDGEWGFMLELNKPQSEWTQKDFINNYEKLWEGKFIEILKQKSVEDVQIYNENVLILGIGSELMIDGFKDESGILLRFKKFDNKWKLYVVQGVG